MSGTHPVTNPSTITFYGADWCGDCRRSKRLLAARETAYEYVDVHANREIRAELTERGYPAIPVIVLPNGTLLMEPSDDALAAALDEFEVGEREAAGIETAPAG